MTEEHKRICRECYGRYPLDRNFCDGCEQNVENFDVLPRRKDDN